MDNMTKESKIGNTYDLNDAIEEIRRIWSKAEDTFDWGGDEGPDGVLSHGRPDFEAGRDATIEVLKKLVKEKKHDGT